MADLIKVNVIVWTDYKTQYETLGLMTGDEEYIYIPAKSRIVIKPMLLRDEKNKLIAYCPDKTHGNLDAQFLIDLAKAQKSTLKLKYKKPDGGVLETITECTGFIDSSIFDNKISPAFGTDASTILRSKILNILQSLDDKQQITMFIFGGLAGIPTGMILLLIGSSLFG